MKEVKVSVTFEYVQKLNKVFQQLRKSYPTYQSAKVLKELCIIGNPPSLASNEYGFKTPSNSSCVYSSSQESQFAAIFCVYISLSENIYLSIHVCVNVYTLHMYIYRYIS